MSELATDLGLMRSGWASSAKAAKKEAPLVVEALAEVSALLAEAKAEHEQAEARYRHWRGIAMVDLVARYSKIAEWKARSEVEGTPQYLVHYETIAAEHERVLMLEGLQRSLLEKSRLVAVIATG